MKGRKLMMLAIIILAIGIVLTITYTGIKSTGVVICGGILFILAGLINLLGMIDTRGAGSGNAEKGEKKNSFFKTIFGWITSTAAIVLGICMLLFQATFSTLVPVIFAILVLSSGLFQFYILAWAIRPIKLAPWFYAGGVALCGCAIYIFTLKPEVDDAAIMLTTGISLIVFGGITLAEGMTVGTMRKRMIARDKTPVIKKASVIDVEGKEIKSLDEN